MKALLADISNLSGMHLFADSAIGRCSAPLFVPEEFAPWLGSIHPAVRIGRLGKCIDPKFAMRYVDAITAVLLMVSPSAGNLTYIADNSIIHGDYIPLSEIGSEITLTLGQSDLTTDLTISPSELRIPALVSALSALTTLKTGDIIILPSPSLPINLENNKNQYITADINGRQCIKIKVK